MELRKARAWSIPDNRYMLVVALPILFCDSDDTMIELFDRKTHSFVQRNLNSEIAFIEESTMLRDKYDNEIYEGDLVKIPDDYDTFGHNAGEVLKVAYDSGCFRLKRPNCKGRGFFFEDNNTVELIGNEFENKDLLGE